MTLAKIPQSWINWYLETKFDPARKNFAFLGRILAIRSRLSKKLVIVGANSSVTPREPVITEMADVPRGTELAMYGHNPPLSGGAGPGGPDERLQASPPIGYGTASDPGKVTPRARQLELSSG